MPRDLAKDPGSHLALTGVVLECPVRDFEVSGAQ